MAILGKGHPTTITFSNISATPAAFYLSGGQYAVIASATFGGGSLTLQVLAPDNVTYVTAATAISAAGVSVVFLPKGQYQLLVTTATAVYCQIVAINEPN
jgi:hypothetical protein